MFYFFFFLFALPAGSGSGNQLQVAAANALLLLQVDGPTAAVAEWNERRVSAAIDKGVERVCLAPYGFVKVVVRAAKHKEFSPVLQEVVKARCSTSCLSVHTWCALAYGCHSPSNAL